YKHHGPFVNLTGIFYDKAPDEKYHRKVTPQEENIRQWAMELVDKELSKADSPIRQEIANHKNLAENYKTKGLKKEAAAELKRISEISEMLYSEAEVHVRRQVALENKLRDEYQLARNKYERGQLQEAIETLEHIARMIREEE
ncbi:MAG: hypothetical protein PHW04_19170, partial [Candidatus Wallbacteria bacterium]|nr:hypothetical protein [Candidatus Wallbacteria bacterium]